MPQYVATVDFYLCAVQDILAHRYMVFDAAVHGVEEKEMSHG